MSSILEPKAQDKIVLPRGDRLDWDHYFMSLAILASLRSPDPSTCVGAILISKDNRVLGMGYNSAPKGVSVGLFNWARDNEDMLKNKYPYILHAEISCIAHASGDLTNSILYVTLHPCNQCAQLIIQKGIKKVFYLKNPYKDTWQVQAAINLFDWAGVEIKQFNPLIKEIKIDINTD